ncbi:potassium/proton antiporter [Sinobaca sp. H24]|uniref:potassium/proton antiporter n=1 Tax=Sinobaca sp. H24 TaxID=2923376 RepID=UPI0027E30A8A|nr:potassium/proton antiporter [Sinobaca sp. H24]
MLSDYLLSDYILLLVGLLLACGVLVSKFSSRLGVPSLILFIGIGMLMGSGGLDILSLGNVEYVQTIGILALVIILFEGGIQTKWSVIRPVAGTALSLATLTVLLTSLLLAGFAYLLLDLTIIEAFLLGALVGSTDAAAVFATLKGKNIKPNLSASMEGEAGANDPMAVFLTLAAIELLMSPDPSYTLMAGSFLWQMIGGVAIGLVLGKIGSYAVNKINMDAGGLYPIFAISFAFIIYSSAQFAMASGFLAVYVAALVIGNSELTYRHSITTFHEGFAWMAQIVMFIVLGALATPEDIFSWGVIWTGVLLSFFIMFIARPAAVFLSTLGSGFSLNDRLFLSWAGLRGAVPIILATFPIVAGVDNDSIIFNTVFFIVLTSALIQGSTIAPLSNKLNVTAPDTRDEHSSWELVNIGKTDAKLIEYRASRNSAIIGQNVNGLNIPEESAVNALVRDGELLNTDSNMEIQAGDTLFILVATRKKYDLKQMLDGKKEKNVFGKNR